MENKELYQRALNTWGVEAQVMMLHEEMGELLTALARNSRGRSTEDDIITELADVSIMVEQIATLIGEEKFEKEKQRKLDRLKERLDKHKDKTNKDNG